MPFVCSHCHSEQTEESTTCSQCGQPWVHGAAPEAQTESDKRFPFWNILPWTLLAAAVLLLLRHPQTSEVRPAAAHLPAAAVAIAAKPVPASAAPSVAALPASPAAMQMMQQVTPVPLTVTLYSASSGRHIRVGQPVTISAYASVAPGQSATLAVSYDKGSGKKSLLALAQGNFSSTVWTPLAPGHYSFTASALDSRKISVFSHHLSIWVDAPDQPASVSVRPLPIYPLPSYSLPVRPAPRVLTASKPAPVTRPMQVVPLHPVVKPALSVPPKPPALVKPPVSATPLPYHVAAATFSLRRIADTLAGALRHRGFHAIVRPMPHGEAHPAYTVETGDYVRQANAQKQVRLLQRDGYPSYIYRLPQ